MQLFLKLVVHEMNSEIVVLIWIEKTDVTVDWML
jgi:hypothetical protein